MFVSFLYPGGLLLFVLTSFFLGGFFVNNKSKKPYLILFQRLFLGSLAIGVLGAFYYTNGITIYLVIGFLAIVYFILQKGLSINTKPYVFSVELALLKKVGLPFCILLVFCFLLQLFRVYDLQGNAYAMHSDFIYYGRLAFYISEKGIESHAFDVFANTSWAPSMYHYLEIWQTAVIARIFDTNMTYALYLTVYPFYFTLGITGLLAYFEQITGALRLWHYLLAVSVLFVSAFGFTDISQLFSHVYSVTSANYSLLNYPKLGVLFAAIVFLLNLKPVPGYKLGFGISIAGIMWPAAIPSLFTGYTLWVLYLSFVKKDLNTNIFKALLFPVLTAFLFLCFYGITSMYFPNPEIPTEQSSIERHLGFYLSRYGLVSILYVLVFGFISAFSGLLVYMLLFGYTFRKSAMSETTQNFVSLCLLIIGSGVFYYALFIKLFNSWQLYQNIYITIVGVLLIVLLFYLFRIQNNKLLKLAGLSIIIINILVNSVFYSGRFGRGEKLDVDFYITLVKEYEQAGSPNTGFFREYDEGMSVTLKNPVVNMTGINTALFINEFFPAGFSVLEIPISEDPLYSWIETKHVRGSHFYRFAKSEYCIGQDLQANECILQFMKRYDVRFVFFQSMSQIPALLTDLEHRSLYNPSENFGVLIFPPFDGKKY